MSPIDDELRAALHGRAQVLTPSPDLLAGIEARAKRMQRNRIGAAVAGSALAVALVAAVVPAIQSTTSSQPDVPRFATSAPSTEPSEAPALATRPTNAFDWGGDPLTGEGLDRGVRAQWAGDHELAPEQVRGERMFSAQLPDAEQSVAIYQLWSDGTPAFSVVAQGGDGAQVVLVRDTQSTAQVPFVDAVVSVVEPYVAVAVAPTVTALEYAGDGSTYDPVRLAGGGGLTLRTLGAGPGADRLRVTDGGRAFDADVYAGPTHGEEGSADGEPANLLDWPFRGDRSAGPSDEQVERAFATALGREQEPAVFRGLFAGSTDGGLSYVMGQAWLEGQDAINVGLWTGGENGTELFLGRVTDPQARLLAFVPCCSPGLTVDQLVVIPEPGTSQVSYAPDGEDFRPVGEGQDNLDGVVIIDRDPRAQADRLQLLDGDGDLDAPTFTGPVAPLLCGYKECG